MNFAIFTSHDHGSQWIISMKCNRTDRHSAVTYRDKSQRHNNEYQGGSTHCETRNSTNSRFLQKAWPSCSGLCVQLHHNIRHSKASLNKSRNKRRNSDVEGRVTVGVQKLLLDRLANCLSTLLPVPWMLNHVKWCLEGKKEPEINTRLNIVL
jgi:hypothetical protein